MAHDVVTPEEEGGPKVVNVLPLKKGKRVLSFLADYFIVFILGLLLFHIATYPLGQLIVDSQSQYETYLHDAYMRDSVLYGHELLFAEEGKSTHELADYTANLSYTSKRFISYYMGLSVETDEVFKHYEQLTDGAFHRLDIYKELNDRHPFFDIVGESVTLKSQYVEEFMPMFRPGDTMSERGLNDYTSFQNDFFVQCYSTMLQDINVRDLTYANVSYVDYQKKVAAYNQSVTTLIVACSLIAFAISWLVDWMLFPMVNRTHKTLAMLFLRHERVSSEKLTVLPRKKIPLVALYGLAFSASSLLFVPWGSIGFNELFSLPLLLPLSIVSLALSLLSLAFLLFDEFGRTLGDRLSFSVMVDEATLGEIARAKGYDF